MNYTSIEQSKKLLELGLNPKSADNSWILSPVTNKYIRTASVYDCNEDIPCWSVGQLLDLLSYPNFYKDKLGDIDAWFCECYLDEDGIDVYQSDPCSSQIDVLCNTMEYMLTNKLLKYEI